jgi:hypothetical protein
MVDMEQRFHDLEQRHLVLRNEKESISAENESLKGAPLVGHVA